MSKKKNKIFVLRCREEDDNFVKGYIDKYWGTDEHNNPFLYSLNENTYENLITKATDQEELRNMFKIYKDRGVLDMTAEWQIVQLEEKTEVTVKENGYVQANLACITTDNVLLKFDR